jgi:predicted DsbA family dithiol-disulfide isomerase
MDHLSKTAAELGLPFGERKKTFNSRLAQELGLWAELKKKGHGFRNAAFKAYFVDGKNIGKMPVLLDLASSVGLPVEEAEAILVTGSFRDAVDADWLRAREKGITAVPTFLMGQGKLVGAQPYHVLEKFVETNGAGTDFQQFPLNTGDSTP